MNQAKVAAGCMQQQWCFLIFQPTVSYSVGFKG